MILLFFYGYVIKDLFDSSKQHVVKVGRVDVRGEIAHQQRMTVVQFRVSSFFGNCQWLLVRLLGIVPFVLPYPTEGGGKGLQPQERKVCTESCGVMWSHVLFICVFPVIAQPGKHGRLPTQQLFHSPFSC